jgi:FHA domain/Protein of unknown function (DUF3662)
MTNPHLARIEAQLERLIEGTFAQLFGRHPTAHDILLHIARAIESNLEQDTDDTDMYIAPDNYVIQMNTGVHEELLRNRPDLPALFGEHVTELVASRNFKLERIPQIRLQPNYDLAANEIVIEATHLSQSKHATAVLERITDEIARYDENIAQRNPHIIINGDQTIVLNQEIFTIGRAKNNDIVLNDPYISRYHAQVRLRFGTYTFFDIDSQGGSFINDVRVIEHRLQSGDVIVIGRSKLVYLEDNPNTNHQTSITFQPHD